MQALIPADPRARRLFRARLADRVERLISLMDQIDGDPDFEPDADDELEPDVEMNGDEQDFSMGAEDEHAALGGMHHSICYGMGTAFVRNDGSFE